MTNTWNMIPTKLPQQPRTSSVRSKECATPPAAGAYLAKLSNSMNESLTRSLITAGAIIALAGYLTLKTFTMTSNRKLKTYELKELRESLEFGDVSRVAKLHEVSPKTVQRALRGETTNHSDEIIQSIQSIVKARADHNEELRRIIMRQRAARLQAGNK